MAETKSESSSKRVSFATTDEIIEPGVHAPLDVLLDPKLAAHTEDKVDKSNGTHEPAKVVGENVDEVSDMFKSITKNESVSGSADKESSTTEAEVTDMFKGLSKKKKKPKKAGDEIPAQPASDEDPLPSSTTEKKEEEITNMFEGLAKKKKKLKKAGDDVPAQPASAEDPLPSPTTEKKEEEVTNMFEGLSKKKKNSKKAGDEISAQPAPAEDLLPSLTTEEKGGEVTNIFEGLSKKKKKSKKVSNEIPGEPASAEDPLPSSTTGGKEEEDLSTDPTKKKKKKSIKVEDDTSAEPARTLSADPQTADAPAPEPKIITDDEVTDMFKGLAKKKKAKRTDKKSKSAEPTEAELEAGPDGEGEEEGGDPDEGTGIWNHNAKKDLKYGQLLDRFFQILQDKNPDMMSGKVKSYKIPPPQCVREGNKKTIFANIADICNRMDRSDEHVTSYLFAELGTNGSVDGSRRLVIKGRFQQKQIENVLRRYIVEYVTCKTCRSQSTAFSKGDHRLYYVTCNSCSSSRSVTTIKTGFTAQIGKRKKMQA